MDRPMQLGADIAPNTYLDAWIPIAGGKVRKVRVFGDAETARKVAPPAKPREPAQVVHFVHGDNVVKGEIVGAAKYNRCKVRLADGAVITPSRDRLFKNAFSAACSNVKRCRDNLQGYAAQVRHGSKQLTKARALLKRVRARRRG